VIAPFAQLADRSSRGCVSALDASRRFGQTRRPLKAVSASQLRKPMRIASNIATALSAATGRSGRPNDWQRIGVCMAYMGFSSSTIDRASQGSRMKPE
jgi:hypothetical protein